MTYLIDPALVDDATVMAGAGPGVDASRPRPDRGRPDKRRSQRIPAKSNAGSKSGVKAAASPGAAPALSHARGAVSSGRTAMASSPAPEALPRPAWLANLRAAVHSDGAAVVGLPYGDTDLVALERAGLTKDVAIARSTGQSTLESELGVTAAAERGLAGRRSSRRRDSRRAGQPRRPGGAHATRRCRPAIPTRSPARDPTCRPRPARCTRCSPTRPSARSLPRPFRWTAGRAPPSSAFSPRPCWSPNNAPVWAARSSLRHRGGSIPSRLATWPPRCSLTARMRPG